MAVTVMDYPASLPTRHQIIPVAVPAIAEDVVSENVYLQFAHFTNGGSASIDITISDKQGSPLEVFRVTVDPKAPVSWNPGHHRYCPGGINWVASGSGVVGYLVWSK